MPGGEIDESSPDESSPARVDTAPVHRDRDIPDDIEPVDAPIEVTRCPGCGAEPTPESIASHRLSASGYLHDDVRLECETPECDRAWTLGVPIGEPPESVYADLVCGCGTIGTVHRVRIVSTEKIKLHLKCPRCYTFFTAHRTADDSGLALIGNPLITGSMDGATPYGYDADAVPETGAQIGVNTDETLPREDPDHAVVRAEPPRADRHASVSVIEKPGGEDDMVEPRDDSVE